jgi:hypothetical protein
VLRGAIFVSPARKSAIRLYNFNLAWTGYYWKS